MATMTDCFFQNDNQKSINFDNSQTVHDNRYSNLNLNQNLKCSDVSPIHFNNKLYNNKHFGIAATLKLSESLISDNSEGIKNPSYLYKPSKISNFSNCNEIEDSKKPWKKNISLNTINDSTLSLHIVAYKNSVETDSFNGCKNKDWQKGKSDSIKNEKQIFTAAKFVFLNPFEFPRQQNDEIPGPELSHFKASQQLLNSNKSDANTESAKGMERKKRRSVYRLPNFTKAQRAAYYGLPYTPSTDDEEDDNGIAADGVENQSESSLPSYTVSESLINAFVPPGKTPKPDDDNDRTIAGENVRVQAQENQTQNESSLPSYTISESLINAFVPPGKTPKPDDDNDRTIAGENVRVQSQENYTQNESSLPSYTISESLINAFVPPGKTPKLNDDNDRTTAGENVQVQSQENYTQNESSLPSYTISESLINAFVPPGKTPKPDDDNDRTIVGENVQVQAQENQTQNVSSLPSYTISESLINAFVPPGKTPKAIDAVDDDVEMMEVDEEEYQKSFVSNQHELVTTSSQPPFDFRAPKAQPLNTARVMTSRLSLLLPRFMQPTTSSSARTSKKPVSCSSPVCLKRTNPPSIMAQESRAPATTSRSLQRPNLTPRKSVAVCRKVLDQSFNAAKLPVLDVSQFKEFQPNEKSRPPQSSGGKRIHPSTPQQSKPTSKFGVSNKENLNRTKAFDLLQQYESPVTPRVAPKRITPNSNLQPATQFNEIQPVETSRLHHHTSGGSNDPESQIDQDFGKLTFADEKESSGSHSDESVKTITPRSSFNVLDDVVLQTPTSSKNTTRRTIPESPIDHDFENAEPSTSLHCRSGYIPDSPIDHDFDFANPSTRYNSSVFSVNTPGPSRSAFPKGNPLIPVNFQNESNMTINDSTRSNESVIKITAAQKKNDKKVKYVLAKPKLVKPHSPEIDQPNLRRSQRTRVRRLRSDLNEFPVYDIDKNGLATLVDTQTVEVKNPRAEKYLTVSPGEQIEREKALKKRQKSRQEFAKVQRERENDL